MWKNILFLMLVMACLATSARGATWVVRQDGTGDFSTIGAAVAAAAADDLVRVGPGTYGETILITASLTIESESGAAVTVLDGLDSQRIMLVDGDLILALRGLTFTRGHADHGSAMLAWNSAAVTAADCRFVANFAEQSNAVHVRHAGSSLTLRNCLFQDNVASVHSGALSASMDSDLVVELCQFIGNTGSGSAGAMNVTGANVVMRDCLFLRNVGGNAGAFHAYYSTGIIENNTFHDNSGNWCTVYMYEGGLFRHNIVSGERHGYGFTGGEMTRACNVFDGNALGATAGPLSAGEVDADPLFCEPLEDVFLVCSGSPAAPGMSDCGQIGAFGVGCGCGPISVENRSWGEVKSLFR